MSENLPVEQPKPSVKRQIAVTTSTVAVTLILTTAASMLTDVLTKKITNKMTPPASTTNPTE